MPGQRGCICPSNAAMMLPASPLCSLILDGPTEPNFVTWDIFDFYSPPPSNSVRRRLLHVVDHHDVRVRLGALQLQAQLLL
jgi:hypothetical protein